MTGDPLSSKIKRKMGSSTPISRELRNALIAERGEWHCRRMMLFGGYYSAPLFAAMQKRYDLLRDEYGILGNLYDYGPLTAQLICSLTGRPKNSVSRGVSRLIELKRISSHVNPDDRRECVLRLEDPGRKLYEKVLPMWRDRERQLLSGLNKDDLVKLDQILEKLLNNYHEHHG